MLNKYPQFIKYKRIPFLDEILDILKYPVEAYEKLDGGNVQVRMHKGVILAGNRSKFLTDKDTRFEWFQDFLKWAKGNYSFYNLPENLIVYGEWLSHHTLDYPKEDYNKFYFIDVFDTEKKRFIKYPKAKKELLDFGLQDIQFLEPLIEGKTSVEELEELVQNSQYRDGEAEGVVIKHYPTQCFGKLWISSIRKHDEVHYDEFKKIYLSIVEDGRSANRKTITDELYEDLKKSGTLVPLDKVKEYVNHHYNFLINDVF